MVNLNNRRLVLNNDFDGCLCGYILLNLFEKNKIIGFSNSKDIVWLVDGEKLDDTVLFIDMFTLEYQSIDQHIHPMDFEKGFNPNNERHRYTFTDYTRKYPFSTAFWLLAVAARQGKDISKVIPALKKMSMGDKYYLCDIYLRADDSLLNACKYKTNCEDWRKYLVDYSNNNIYLKQLFEFIFSKKEDEVEKWKIKMDNHYCKEGLNKEELPDITTEKAKKFFRFFGITYNNITSVIHFERIKTTLKTLDEFNEFYEENKEHLFSFAFVYGPNKKDVNNFSYSIKIQQQT